MSITVAARRTVAACTMGALAAFGACKENEDTTGPNDDLVASIQTDAQILAAIHESNVGEITAGQAALQKASAPQIKAFAESMITEHTALDQQGTTLAAQLGITPALPDQRLVQLQAREAQTLGATAAGSTFDHSYIAQQITAHTRTVALVDAGIARATRAEIRTMLQQARPIIVADLDLARNRQSTLGNP